MTRVIADFHIHSKYSRATSDKMDLREIARFAQTKGLNIVGTGDATHHKWFNDLRENLTELPDAGLYRLADNPEGPVNFMITVEVSTIFTFEGSTKKIHHVILVPSLDVAAQVNERLARYGDLTVDGRPILDMTAPQLVEEVMSVSGDNVVIPSHIWTPWFGLFGAFSGFNQIEDCYQDTTRYVPAIETGLSSDPPMNWRLSSMDRFALVSNSDSHSSWPWRIGREANVFELEEDEITYGNIVDAIRKKDGKLFKFTVETDPNYGKYHFDGHRVCSFSCSPEQTKRLNGFCPRCKRRLTIGVLSRVEQLADRPEGFVPKDAIPFKDLIPLYEIISFTMGVEQLYSKKVLDEQNKLIDRFGNEFNVLLKVSKEELVKVTHEKIADSIVRLREGKVKFVAGYDGVYGKPIFGSGENLKDKITGMKIQSSLTDFNAKGP